MKKRKILFCAPHSFVWSHAFPEAVIAESLRKHGHEVVYLTCGELFRDFCVCMSSAGLGPTASAEQKAAVCHKCRSNAGLLSEKMWLPGYELASRVTPEDHSRAASLARETTVENFQRLELDGVQVGRLAMYEILIRYKKIRLDFTPQEWAHYQLVLTGALLSHFASRRVLQEERPHAVVSFNTNYSVLGVVGKNAASLGIKSYCMTNGGNFALPFGFLMFGERSPYHYTQGLVRKWQKYKHLPCTPASLRLVTDFMLELFRGESVFVYSAPKARDQINVRERIGAQPGQKIVVATLSSYDERFASNFIGNAPAEKGMLFESQLEWVSALVRWATPRPNVFVVIRVHPREFPNKREGRKSDHATLLEEALRNLPKNMAANFPSDGLSLYDLVGETSVLLNAWSSAGKELSALGIPVVLYSQKLLDYPHDLHFLGETEEEYFRKIDLALAEGWNAERILRTYRWRVLEAETGLVDVRDSFPHPPSTKWDFKSRVIRKLGEKIPWLDPRRRNLRERGAHFEPGQVLAKMFSELTEGPLDADDSRLFPRDKTAAEAAERSAMRDEIRRLAKGLWGPTALTDPAACPLQANFQEALKDT